MVEAPLKQKIPFLYDSFKRPIMGKIAGEDIFSVSLFYISFISFFVLLDRLNKKAGEGTAACSRTSLKTFHNIICNYKITKICDKKLCCGPRGIKHCETCFYRINIYLCYEAQHCFTLLSFNSRPWSCFVPLIYNANGNF